MIAFALWEKYLAPVTFIPWPLLKNRTMFFTHTMVASVYIAAAIWDGYFYSLCIVLFRQTNTGATFCSVILGICIRYYGRLKRYALFFGVPLSILGIALMIHFRQPGVNVGYIVMCQVFIAFGGGALDICEHMTVMAVSTHQNIPAVLAMESLVALVGSSVGQAISAAMWTGIFPKKLSRIFLSAPYPIAAIYGDLVTQASYPVGSATRTAIDKS